MTRRMCIAVCCSAAGALIFGAWLGLSVFSAGEVATFWLSRDWPGTAQASANVAQIVAYAIAGVWTYQLFVRQRHDRVRANLDHRVVVLGKTAGQQVVRVEVIVKNIGNVVLTPPKARSSSIESGRLTKRSRHASIVN